MLGHVGRVAASGFGLDAEWATVNSRNLSRGGEFAELVFKKGDKSATSGQGVVATNAALGRSASQLPTSQGHDEAPRASGAAAPRSRRYALNGGVWGDEARRTGP